MLPGRLPVGIDPVTRKRTVFASWEGEAVNAAAAFMAPAHTQGHRAAYVAERDAPVLPLFAYTALAYAGGRFYAAGVRVDDDPRQDPWRFRRNDIERGIAEALRELPANRLVQQLKNVRAGLQLPRARRISFLGRHEAPLPTSVACNSRCVGCLSLQEDGGFKAAHDRLETPAVARGHRRGRRETHRKRTAGGGEFRPGLRG